VVSSVFVVPLAPVQPSRSAASRSPARKSAGLPTERASRGQRPEPLLLTEFVGDRESGLIRIVVDSFLAEPRYNPLVIVGSAAVGKSALTTGLATRWNKLNPNCPAMVLRGDDFARAYADALETDSLERFRRKFLQAGAVVIDGLESLVEKVSAQLEFARLLDLLCDQKIPTLATCRRDSDLPQFHPALWSRLHGGLLAPLLAPGVDARRKILGDLLRVRRIRLETEAIELLVRETARDQTSRPTVPQLVQVVEQLAASASDVPQPWSVETVENYLAERSPSSNVSTGDIARIVADYFGLRVSELKGASRRRQVARARGLATYLARQVTGQSLQGLGQFFGGRDHTTTMHACRTMEELLKTDTLLQQAAAAITQRFRTPTSTGR